jgi:GT2 family glycosyltransferase
MTASPPPAARHRISVIVLNYNGRSWLKRCFESLERQSFYSEAEFIIVDNHSPDGSAQLVAEWAERGEHRKLIANQTNLYFCEANNVGAEVAQGEFLFFLNNDLWLEPDCLEKLYQAASQSGAECLAPVVLNYADDSFQGIGADGLDWFGIPTQCLPPTTTVNLFSAYGCALFIRRDFFKKIGGFDMQFLMYADETDLSWRVWIAGGKILAAPDARLHHRGAAAVNPQGGIQILEARTSDTKRYLANRNNLCMLLKNGQHLLLLLVITHLLLLLVEAVAVLLLVRRWSHIRHAYLAAVRDVFRMRQHILESRRRIRQFRRHGDFWMLRFLRLMPSRLDEVKRLLKFGPPKVDKK